MWSPESRGTARLALAALAAVALLAGCGFHLRGAVTLSERMSAPYIDAADRFTPFHAELIDSLRAAGAVLAPSRESATAVVHIHRDRVLREVLTISARNTPQEYQVVYTVEYSVSAGGQELLPRQTLSLSRDYAFDDTAVLAKQHEEADIRAALARDLATLVVGRLAAL